MDRYGKIKVLVVDDSLLFRESIKKILSLDFQIEVVAVASNPFEARDRILEKKPDVLLCDVEMPGMNGIEFVRRLLPQYFVPVVMVSAVSDKVFEAMEAGAVDFVVKPDPQKNGSVEAFGRDMIQKIKAASNVKAACLKPEPSSGKISGSLAGNAGRIIAIGASTGGTEAIYNVLSALPPTIPGIVIVQHIPPVFSRMFAERLDTQTVLHVKEASTGDLVEKGSVYVAPGDRQMRIKKAGTKYRIECFQGEKVNGHCPSVDVLFDSVAREAGKDAIGILLTGMGYDGAKGMLAMRRKGCRTIGQDEASSVVYGMPKVAYDIGGVEKQAPLGNIPQVLCGMLN
ncbi:MAG: chemotaxis response regulator protein-glutamate methylesterase [Lachnospiraceae bacterium]